MAKFHINPKTGEPGKCSADNGNCPFGSADQHYTSIDAARAAFEENNSTFPLSLKEMNAQAKATADPAIIKQLISAGSDRTLGNLAKNPNLVTKDAEEMLKRTTNPVVRAAIYMNKKFVLKFDDITPDDLEEIAFRQNPRDNDPLYYPTDNPLARMAKDPFITEAHYDRLESSPRLPANVKKSLPSLLGQANKIYRDRTVEWLNQNNWPGYPLSPDSALVAGKLKEDDLVTAPDHYIGHFSAVGPSPRLTTKEVDLLSRVGLRRADQRLIEMTASDSRISPKALESVVAAGKGSEGIYKNPKLTPEGKRIIETQFAGEPFVKVGQLKERIGQKEFDLIKSNGFGRNLGRSYTESVVNFDTKRVEKYDLSKEDIFYMAGAKSFNAGTQYNEATGEFTGRVDSSD